MKKIILFVALFFILDSVFAYKEHNFLGKMTDVNGLQSMLVMNQEWVEYPDYSDREGWDQFLGHYKEQYISDGEKHLEYNWQVMLATSYLDFQRSGARSMQAVNKNNRALISLFMAELAEGKGRFIDQIINGVFLTCEMTSWVSSAHLLSQPGGTPLPNHKYDYIDLTAGGMGANLSWIYYYLAPEFDKVNPLITERLRDELQKRILDPYLENTYFWWLATNFKKGQMVNNWNPWCNSNCLLSFMLLEKDPEVLAQAVYKSMVSVDKFINYTKEDGACEEGPSYWGHAGGKMYDYLQMLSDLTVGQISIFDQPMIKHIGEYMARTYVGDGWQVNFADASGKGGGEAPLVYRYGKAVDSKEMMGYAKSRQSDLDKAPNGGDLFRAFESIATADEMRNNKVSYAPAQFTWYPQTEFCYMRDDKSGLFFAAKGGYNNESHNHNDAGTFILYLDHMPVFIDVGVGTYSRATFSSKRYSIWTMQSNYHNLPVINGKAQPYGGKYKATETKFDPKRHLFSTNIARAYGDKANVEKWLRSYTLRNGALKIEDAFKINGAEIPNVVNFMTWGDVDISKLGVVTVDVQGKKLALKYDAKLFTPSIETIKQDDTRLSNVWGAEVYRVSLTALKVADKGKYTFVIKKLL